MTLASTILTLNPIAYWKLDETSGTAAINYGTLGTAANGTYSGVTLNQIDAPGGGRAGRWDAVNDYLQVYSATLNTNFPRTLGTLFIWYKVYDAAVWTDSTIREFVRFLVNASNYAILRKENTNNTLSFFYNAGGTLETLTSTAYNNTDWNMIALTWSDAGDEVKWFVNNGQVGATQTGIGTFTGNLNSTQTVIGASNSSTPANVWNGYLSHCALFSSVLTPEQIAAIYAAGIETTTAYSLTADAGSIALTGQDATLTAFLQRLGCVTAADTTLATVTGADTTLATVTGADTCLYTVTGSDMQCT